MNHRTYITTGRRGGRMTAAQNKVMQNAQQHSNLIAVSQLGDWPNTNGSNIVEVGFGMGDSLYAMARHNEDENYLGMDVYEPGVAALLKKINDYRISNLSIVHHDAIEAFEFLPPNSIDRIQCYFPDPWRKKRHRKRRLFHTAFNNHVERTLKDNGVWHIITDWLDYADDLVRTLGQGWLIENKQPSFYRPMTKYEKRGIAHGHEIYEFLLSKR